jgi:hypothetical protein
MMHYKGFPNDEISKSEILDMVCYENFRKVKIMLKSYYKVMNVKWASSTWHRDTVNTAVKEKGEEGNKNA